MFIKPLDSLIISLFQNKVLRPLVDRGDSGIPTREQVLLLPVATTNVAISLTSLHFGFQPLHQQGE